MNGMIHKPKDVGHTLCNTVILFVKNAIGIGLKYQHFIGGKGIWPSHLAVCVYIYRYK